MGNGGVNSLGDGAQSIGSAVLLVLNLVAQALLDGAAQTGGLVEQRSARVDLTIRLAGGGTRGSACLFVLWSVLRDGRCPSGSWWAGKPHLPPAVPGTPGWSLRGHGRGLKLLLTSGGRRDEPVPLDQSSRVTVVHGSAGWTHWPQFPIRVHAIRTDSGRPSFSCPSRPPARRAGPPGRRHPCSRGPPRFCPV